MITTNINTNTDTNAYNRDTLVGMDLIYEEWERFTQNEEGTTSTMLPLLPLISLLLLLLDDISFTEAMNRYLSSPHCSQDIRCVNLALADINTDCGLSLRETSFKHYLSEPGTSTYILPH